MKYSPTIILLFACVFLLLLNYIELKARVDVGTEYNIEATVSAYSADVSQTDSTPYQTAFMTQVKPWTVAVSRDLFNRGWVPGKYVYIEGIGRFRINDLMHQRKKYQLDIFFYTKKQALRFGLKKSVRVALLEI